MQLIISIINYQKKSDEQALYTVAVRQNERPNPPYLLHAFGPALDQDARNTIPFSALKPFFCFPCNLSGSDALVMGLQHCA